jgi:hypothetical protein
MPRENVSGAHALSLSLGSQGDMIKRQAQEYLKVLDSCTERREHHTAEDLAEALAIGGGELALVVVKEDSEGVYRAERAGKLGGFPGRNVYVMWQVEDGVGSWMGMKRGVDERQTTPEA